jgi:hypothetical protein
MANTYSERDNAFDKKQPSPIMISIVTYTLGLMLWLTIRPSRQHRADVVAQKRVAK